MMNDAEIQARTVIAAALIQRGSYSVPEIARVQDAPLEYQPIGDLRAAVDAIYRALMDPK